MTIYQPFPSSSQANLQIDGPAGKLQVLTSYPSASNSSPSSVAVICHPHPLFGGTLNNKVVTTLARSFILMGFSTVRFNFRGVGESEGSYDRGLGETDDLLSILQWLKIVCPQQTIYLAGFSFGAYVAARGAKKWQIKQLICIAPPLENFPFKTLPPFSCPWILIQGEKDEVVSANAVLSWAENLDPRPKIIRVKHATHFFHGHLIELREKVITVLSAP